MLTPKPSIPGTNPTVTDQQAGKKQRGTGFTNINRILGANVGAGQRMGETIGGSLEEQSKKIREGIEKGKSEFQAGVSEQTQKAQEASGKAKDIYGNIMAGTGVAAIPGAAEAGANLRDIQYSGPGQIKNIAELQGQASNLAALGRLSGFSGGQEQLLRSQIAKRGGYGLGQSALDQLLLGQGGQAGLQRGGVASSGISQLAEQEQKSAEQQAQTAARGIEANKLATLQEFQKGLTGEQGLQTLAKQRADTFAKNANRIKELMSGVDSSGKTIKKGADISKGETELTPEDENLLQNLDQMGIPLNKEIYGGDKTQLATTLSAIGQQLNPKTSGFFYQSPEEQRKAQDLGTLISGLEAGKQIGSTKYDTNIYTGNEKTFGATTAAKETAMNAAKQQDMAPVDRLLKNSKDPFNVDSDWQTLNQLMPGSNNIIDAVFDRNAGKGDKDSVIKVAQAFKGTPLEKYAEQLENQVQEQMSRREFQNRFGGLIAKERKSQIDATDYSKDPRIASQNVNVFDALRQQLGLPVIKTAGDILPPRTGPSQSPGNVYHDFYNNSIIKT